MEANYLTILWFLPYINMNQPWVYICVSPSWTPSPSHLSGLSQSTCFECPASCIDLHWSSISHMVIYMFQCYSLKSSHPHLLPHSPKVCSSHLYLLCCLAYRVIITIFLNSVYMRWYTVLVFFYLTYFTLYIASSFIHLNRTESNTFFFIALCICTTAFLSIHLLMTTRLFPHPSYCKQCCNKYWGTCISFNSVFLSVYAQQWDCWVVWQFYFQIFFLFF